MKRIDINACFGHWQYWDLHHKTPAELVGSMDRCGIERAAALSLRGVFVDWRAGNDETFAAAKQFPGRLIPAVTLSPFLDGTADEVKQLVDRGARCVRLYPSFHSYRLDSAFVDDVCRVAGERNVPVMIPSRIMMNWRFTPVATDLIGAVALRHPKTHIIFSGPNYLAEYQLLVQWMLRAPNTSYEFSCMQGFGAIARLVREVGVERVLFGTGAVLNYPACNVAKLDHADLAGKDRDAIASENAAKLLRLAVA